MKWLIFKSSKPLRLIYNYSNVRNNPQERILNSQNINPKTNEPVQSNLFYDNITPRTLRNMNIKGAFVPAENDNGNISLYTVDILEKKEQYRKNKSSQSSM
jgi:hypothetical protein